MKIAVFIDENGIVLPFLASGVVNLYSDDTGEWQCVNQIPFDLNNAGGIKDIRMRVKMLISEFEDCELLVIDGIKGITKVVLEEFKVGIWQYNGFFLLCLLDKIRDELHEVKAEQDKNRITPVLVGKAADAVYEINLGAILDNNCGLNSREILLPFIQNTPFRKLIIDCKHIPKWFEGMATLMKLNYEITDTNDGEIRIVTKPIGFETGIEDRKRIKWNNDSKSCSGGCCGSDPF
jgi:Fe-only nitrogenase accessory protein AnfO